MNRVTQPSRLRVRAASRRAKEHGAGRPASSQAGTPALRLQPRFRSSMREMLRGNLSMNLGAPAPLPAGCLWKIRRQGCRRSQKRLVGSEGSLFRGILSPSDRETVSEGRVRVSVFARSHSSSWLSKKEEPELSSRLFVRFAPSLRFDSDPSGLNGGNRVL